MYFSIIVFHESQFQFKIIVNNLQYGQYVCINLLDSKMFLIYFIHVVIFFNLKYNIHTVTCNNYVISNNFEEFI